MLKIFAQDTCSKKNSVVYLVYTVMVRSYYIHTRYGPSQDIFPRISVILYFISSRIISPTIHTFIYFASLFGLKGPNKRRRFKTYSYVVKGFSDIPPASTLGKVYAHYNSTNDLTPRSNILASIGNTSSS